MGTWEHIKLGEFPWNNALRFFCWGRPLKVHIEIKNELFRDGCICAKKKRQKKGEVWMYILPMVYIHSFVVRACSMV
jgi:hypothetical protein